jgi:hypothetical protein
MLDFESFHPMNKLPYMLSTLCLVMNLHVAVFTQVLLTTHTKVSPIYAISQFLALLAQEPDNMGVMGTGAVGAEESLAVHAPQGGFRFLLTLLANRHYLFLNQRV